MAEPETELTKRLSKFIADNLQAAPNATVEQLVERLKTDDRIIQINQENALAFQTFVEKDATANIGIHLHDFDEEKLDQVLKAFWKFLQPAGIPNNLPRSGVVQFVGREPELARLHQQLQQSNRPAITTISGMAGIGKTELAVQYAHTHLSDYPGGICWLQARGSDLKEQIIDFVQSKLKLQIPPRISDKNLTLDEQVQWCWHNWQPSETALIVLDDVNDLAKCENVLPNLWRFRILITTRQRGLNAHCSELSLDVLSAETALELLTKLVGEERIARELQAAEQLCEWLGYLPLGLNLVGHYLTQDRVLSLVNMLKRLDIQDESLNKTHPLMNRQHGVRAAFELSWRELDPTTVEVALLLSLFAPTIIPWKLVEAMMQQLQRSEQEIHAARKQLDNLHLIQPIDESGESYKIHPLIREFLQAKWSQSEQATESSSEQSLRQAFIAVIAIVAPQIPDVLDRELIEDLAAIMPHFEKVAQEMTTDLSDENLPWIFAGLIRFYKGQGLYTLAKPWCRKYLRVTRKRFGTDHAAVADSLYYVGHLYFSQGRYREAERLLVQALELRKRLLGDEHSDLLINFQDLGNLYRIQRRFGEAERLLSQAVNLSERLLEEDHPWVATSLNNLGMLYYSWSRLGENEQLFLSRAEQLFSRALELNKRRLKKEHPDGTDIEKQPAVTANFNNLALVYDAQKCYNKAEELYVKLEKINKEILPEGDPRVAASVFNLGVLHSECERYSEAEQRLEESLELRKRWLGNSHPDVAESLYRLAELYDKQKRYNKAKPLYEQALDLTARVFGDQHRETEIIRKELKECCNKISKDELIVGVKKTTIGIVQLLIIIRIIQWVIRSIRF